MAMAVRVGSVIELSTALRKWIGQAQNGQFASSDRTWRWHFLQAMKRAMLDRKQVELQARGSSDFGAAAIRKP
jgi:hypothetical protein